MLVKKCKIVDIKSSEDPKYYPIRKELMISFVRMKKSIAVCENCGLYPSCNQLWWRNNSIIDICFPIKLRTEKAIYQYQPNMVWVYDSKEI